MKKLSEVINYLIKEDIDSEGNIIQSNTTQSLPEPFQDTEGNTLLNFSITTEFRNNFEIQNGKIISGLNKRLNFLSGLFLYNKFEGLSHIPSEKETVHLNKNIYEITYNGKKRIKTTKTLNENLSEILKNSKTADIFALKLLRYTYYAQQEQINDIKNNITQLQTFNFLKNLISGKYKYFRNNFLIHSTSDFYNNIDNTETLAFLLCFYIDLLNYVFLCFNNYSIYATSENFIKHIGNTYRIIFSEQTVNLHDNFENFMWKNNNSFLNCIKNDITNHKELIILLNFVDVSNLNFENLTYNIIDNFNQTNNTEKTQQNQPTQQNSSNIQDNDKVAVIWYSTDNRYNDSNFDKNHTWKSIQDFYKNSEFYSKYLEMKKEFRNIAGQNMWVISFHRKNNQIPSYKDKPKKETKQTNVSHTEEPLV